MKHVVRPCWLVATAAFWLLAADNGVATAAIYRCELNGITVYSDRPCAVGALPHEVDGSRVTVYQAEPLTPQPRARELPRKRAARPKAAAQSHDKHQANCAKLAASLRDIRTKMRTGYGVEEGERLKARQRELTERRRAQKCG